MANVWRRCPSGRINGQNFRKQEASSLAPTLAALFFEAPAAGGGVSGSFNIAVAAVAQSATGDLDIAGTLGQTIDPVTLAATGVVSGGAISGTFAQTIASVTLSASGKVILNGSLATTLAAITLAGTGKVIIGGTYAQTVGPITQAASGTVSGGGGGGGNSCRRHASMASMGRMMNR